MEKKKVLLLSQPACFPQFSLHLQVYGIDITFSSEVYLCHVLLFFRIIKAI